MGHVAILALHALASVKRLASHSLQVFSRSLPLSRAPPDRGRGPVDLVTIETTLASMPKAVAVKQLKAKLSEYLRLVKSGETILVTDRDEVVAELRPARRQSGVPDDLDRLLDALANSAEITRASLPTAGWTWHVQGLGLRPGTAQRLLGEVRAERGSP